MDGSGLRGRRTARGLIVLAILYGLASVFLWVAQPGFMDPMFHPWRWHQAVIPILGVASYFLGLGWMIRIYRAQPEPGERTWRYRRLTWRSRDI